MTVGSTLLDTGKTPAQWCEVFAERGFNISERLLRTKARKLGACHILGGAMLITPVQIDIILEESQCRSNRTSEAAHGGRAGRSTSTVARSRSTSARALNHLLNAARGTGSQTAKRSKSVGTT